MMPQSIPSNVMKASRKPPLFRHLLSDDGLTRKAYLNSVTSALEYMARLLVTFITTPIIVAGLGNYYYGVWQVLNRAIGYLSSTSAKPTQVLKWGLASQQASEDYEFKRSLVGSTIVIWVVLLPLMGVIGGILAWFLPFWLKIPMNSYWSVRLTAGVLVVNLISINLAAMPYSILQGENLGYKRMGLSALLVVIGGMLTWIAISLGMGMIGLATTVLITTMLGGILYLLVVQKCVPWFGLARPSPDRVRKFLGISGWFVAWDLIMNLMNSSDVILLGLLNSLESVTSYTLTKYSSEILVGIVAIMVFGIIPGLGGILGSGDLEKACRVRGEIMTLSWLALTFLGTTILLWNRVFLQLWVGEEQFAGTVPNLLIVFAAVQFALIQNDAEIINLSLRIQWKVLLGALSVVLCLVVSSILIGKYKLGIAGISLGFILGRSILSVWYPVLVGRLLNITLFRQLESIIRPLIVMIILFFLSANLSGNLAQSFTRNGLQGWFTFILFAGITAIIFLIIAFYTGLDIQQRRGVLSRLRIIIYLPSR